jgi:hypothetical protein
MARFDLSDYAKAHVRKDFSSKLPHACTNPGVLHRLHPRAASHRTKTHLIVPPAITPLSDSTSHSLDAIGRSIGLGEVL